MTAFEIVSLLAGLASIGSFFVAVSAKAEVRELKGQVNAMVNRSTVKGGQRIKGSRNMQAGGNIVTQDDSDDE